MNVTIVQCVSKNKFPFNLFALAIKFFQKTDYSHYAIKVEDPTTNEVFYYDSRGSGTRKRPASDYAKTHKTTKEFKLSKPIEYINWLEFWAKHNNKKYGWSQVVGLLLRLCKIVKYNPFGQGAKCLICCELVVLFLNHFGYTNLANTDTLDLNDTARILERLEL